MQFINNFYSKKSFVYSIVFVIGEYEKKEKKKETVRSKYTIYSWKWKKMPTYKI